MDITQYAWTQYHGAAKPQNSAPGPTRHRRRTLAGENLWLLRQKHVRELFLTCDVSLVDAYAQHDILSAASAAWIYLRWECPELVLSASVDHGAAGGHGDGDGGRFVEFHVPEDEEEVENWGRRTLIFGSSPESLAFDELRTALCEKKGDASEPAFLYLHALTSDSERNVTKLNFLINMDHLVTDGIGIRILLGKFLRLFTGFLSHSTVRQERDWARCAENLSPAWTLIMNKAQRTSGPDYEEGVSGQVKFLLTDTVR
jgi:hypothetical protein